MIAYVNKQGIVLSEGSLSAMAWEELLDALKSHYIPSFYQYKKRMHVDVSAEGKTRAVIYFTDQTVGMDEAITILNKRHIEVKVVGESQSAS
jgi:hypothetical protein